MSTGKALDGNLHVRIGEGNIATTAASRRELLLCITLMSIMAATLPVLAFPYSSNVGGITWTYTISNGKATITGADFATAAVNADTMVIPSVLGDGKDNPVATVTTIADGALDRTDSFNNLVIPDSIERVGGMSDSHAGAFADSEFQSVVIGNGNGDISIGYAAFAHNKSLCEIKMSDSVKSIGYFAFAYCGIAKWYYDNDEGWNGGDGELSSVTIPNSVTNISAWAFQDCWCLTNVVIGTGVVGIDQSAFFGCNEALFDKDTMPGFSLVDGWVIDGMDGGWRIRNISIPPGVRGIAGAAFSHSYSELESIRIPATVKGISHHAFWKCTSLTNIVFDGDSPVIGESCFEGVNPSCVVHLPRGNTTYAVTDGKWHGMEVEYYEPQATGAVVAVNGAAVEFETAADGKTRTVTVSEGTLAEDVQVFVGGVDVTAGFRVSVEGTTATVVLKSPCESALSAIAPYQENEDGTTVTLNIEVVPGLYYAAESAATLEALTCPGAAKPAKEGDSLTVAKQGGSQGFYKVWVSDAPMPREE